MNFLPRFLKPSSQASHRTAIRNFEKSFKKIALGHGVHKVSFLDSEVSVFQVDRGANYRLDWEEEDGKNTPRVTYTEIWVYRSFPEGKLPLHLLAALSFHELAHHYQAMRGELAGRADGPGVLEKLEREANKFALLRIGPEMAAKIELREGGRSINIPTQQLW